MAAEPVVSEPVVSDPRAPALVLVASALEPLAAASEQAALVPAVPVQGAVAAPEQVEPGCRVA